VADVDILELLLPAVSQTKPQDLAQALLTRFGSFPRVIAAPVWDLLSVDGLGTEAAAVLKCIHLAALRLVRAEVTRKPVLGRSEQLIAYLHAELSRESVEQFRVLFLNNRGRLLADETLQYGTVDHVLIEPRQIAKRALELCAAAMILVHNRPSGDPTPTDDDLAMHEEIRTAAAALAIELVDHIVVGDGCWFSFQEKGLLARTPASDGPTAEDAMPLCDRRSSKHSRVPASRKVGAAAAQTRCRRPVRKT
jgi:DNA repair protein RadC